jgi:hypothetical protein
LINDDSCVRLRAEFPNHVWSYDFVHDHTRDGKAFRTLNMIDEYTRECLTIVVARKFTAQDVLDTMAELFVSRGVPQYIRSDNGPEMTAIAVREWLGKLEVGTLFIEPGSPWESGYCESFNGKLRDELLNGEIFNTMTEARIIIEAWRHHYNTVRPHSSLGWRPPAPEAAVWPGPSPLRSAAPGQTAALTFNLGSSLGAGQASIAIPTIRRGILNRLCAPLVSEMLMAGQVCRRHRRQVKMNPHAPVADQAQSDRRRDRNHQGGLDGILITDRHGNRAGTRRLAVPG